MTNDEMKQLIHDTMESQYEADCYSDEMATRATANPPATLDQLNRLERHLRTRGLTIPPSYLQFLQIHNGIEDFIPSMELSLRSTQDIENASSHDSAWSNISPAHEFVFASGNSSAFAGFLPSTVDQQGEMQVAVVTDSGDVTEYNNFDDFLKDQFEFYQSVIRAEEADRNGLQDD